MSLPSEFTLEYYLKLKEENEKLKTELAALLTTYSEELKENIEYWKTGHNIIHDEMNNINQMI